MRRGDDDASHPSTLLGVTMSELAVILSESKGECESGQYCNHGQPLRSRLVESRSYWIRHAGSVAFSDSKPFSLTSV